jgi:hypothetical protein
MLRQREENARHRRGLCPSSGPINRLIFISFKFMLAGTLLLVMQAGQSSGFPQLPRRVTAPYPAKPGRQPRLLRRRCAGLLHRFLAGDHGL